MNPRRRRHNKHARKYDRVWTKHGVVRFETFRARAMNTLLSDLPDACAPQPSHARQDSSDLAPGRE
jgi:hypothetical protein